MTAIRMASPADAALLARLHVHCFEQAWDEQAFSVFLDDALTFALLAGASGESQAFILVRAAAGESEILSLGTHPDARGLGLARALVTAAGAEAHRRGAARMFLEVAADNETALGLYRKAGFVPTGRRPGYYARISGRAEDAVILSTQLPF
jgi:[ribosomal protein S18]-alanine N-acetyltransferase